jgi:hypothetical protein
MDGPVLIEQLRALGLSMGTVYPQSTHEDEDENRVTTRRYISWTTDEAKAHAAVRLGATLRPYVSRDPECSGFEITANVVEEA